MILLDETSDCSITQEFDYLFQFILRIIILSIALLSSFAILITCLISGKLKYWPFKILAAQSLAECIDLVGALSLSYQSRCYPFLCRIFGYVMHCSWQTSFLCSLLLVYMYKTSFSFDSLKYAQRNRQINKFLLAFYIIPYIWLLYPVCNNYFGPTGWYLKNGEKFIIFCGFDSEQTVSSIFIYSFFWGLPLVCIFSLVIYQSCQNLNKIQSIKQSESESVMGLDIIQGIQRIPRIYVLFWYINLTIRYIDRFYLSKPTFVYYIDIAFNLFFEFHMFIIFIMFYQYYNPILNIKQLWQNLFIKSKDQSELIIEELNPSDEND